ncbi:FadR/GntR family transcriptional regulator [Microbacterium fluvii]|uniref:FadR/GntR family transcriptional regulator n=1 Tax=Microbacterium fluvii TaxID=415215 RepID=A0ABW2HEK4_9MICO|nr:FCD domain-containing protein [Microbacterium fluvii]MCU4673149.1 FCD domain-containing protein [Microbacterium fluvii]
MAHETGGVGSARALETLAFLRRKITSGEWPINRRIPTEQELMELLGVGKTTVREAVRSLASLGMLEPLPGRGTFVRSRTPVSSLITDYISDFELADLLVFRRALEVEAAQQAARLRTEEQLASLREAHGADSPRDVDYPASGRGRGTGPFHATVFDASGSALLTALYAGVMASLRRAIDRGQLVYAGEAQVRLGDHGEVLAAIEAHDVERAAKAMALHVDRDFRLVSPEAQNEAQPETSTETQPESTPA